MALGVCRFLDKILKVLSEGAKRVEELGVDFIDLNLGCPVNKIVKKGAGAALLKDLKSLERVLKSLRASVSIPLSLKVRTGWDASHRNALEVSNMAFDEGFSWMTIHGRSRAQGYSGQADWAYIGEVALKAKLPIIGNGDLHSAPQTVKALKSSQCKGVMIGRGCLSNPWIFRECLQELHGTQFVRQSLKVLLDKFALDLEAFYEERIFLIQLKKFASWFSSGLPHSSFFRKKLFQTKGKQELFDVISSLFDTLSPSPSKEYEPLLKQGHG